MKAHYRNTLMGLSLALLVAACGSSPQQERVDAPPRGDLSGPIVEQRWNLLLVGTDERLSMPSTPFFRIGRDGKPRWPGTESIAKVLEAVDATLGDFSALMEGPPLNVTVLLPELVPAFMTPIRLAKAPNRRVNGSGPSVRRA